MTLQIVYTSYVQTIQNILITDDKINILSTRATRTAGNTALKNAI